ncbi:ABC transporter substrate-binding protein [Haloactinomyces albus]|uniref:Peptide/nickel transport system substrate-binding protein n=1 Tax=Haloactinomyces albus TaxID=1352928 RepID=A0AAE4CNV8_9ACTN|nr:ABC transporter substrate-binding protein [Haloactinomyces albus]MDR7303836.1 peptide/nickel transport system substrate-binding protein [Haloactinomyces albus]
MRTGRRRRPSGQAAGLLAAMALTASCTAGTGVTGGSEQGSGKAISYEVGMISPRPGGNPVDGGTLTFGAYSEPTVLDPARTIVAGSTGGVSMAAIYDVLMRYDTSSGEVVPQLAKALEHNADHTKWTLTLRDGVTFSDGTPLNAAAVKWSIERYVELGATDAALWSANVTGIATPDEHAVVFRLKRTWPSFAFMLAGGPGMIVARSAEEEGFTPVGAGPFVFDHHAPGEEIVLRSREDHWDGAAHLDQLRVIFLDSAETRLDSLRQGGIQAGFFRDPPAIEQAVGDGYAGFMNLVSLGNVAVINAAPGRPGADPRIRKAMHQAIDPQVIHERAYAGADLGSKAVFPEFSRWHTDTEPLPYDPKAARALVHQAKADGFDGVIRYTDAQDPASRATALAVKSMLERVGFTVELDLVRSVPDQISTVAVEGDYDVAGWGISWREAGPYARMFATLHSAGNLSVGMHTGPEMDTLIERFQQASTAEEQRAAMRGIQQLWNKTVPALVYGPTPELLTWSTSLRGVEGTLNSMVLLDEAWLAR